ncbi:MAG: hypothetical protein E7560_00175 [Ruminococcaceae bacterium]|nr:hypothetical protein [Oscillospiraceae bacterium]
MSAEQLEFIKLLITEITMMLPVIVAIFLIIQGIKCLLRSEMLRTYYHNKDKEEIRQYELENFIALYKAYKALKGNSFIDKIHKEVMSWEVIT